MEICAPRRSVTAEKRGSQTRFEQLFPSTEYEMGRTRLALADLVALQPGQGAGWVQEQREHLIAARHIFAAIDAQADLTVVDQRLQDLA